MSALIVYRNRIIRDDLAAVDVKISVVCDSFYCDVKIVVITIIAQEQIAICILNRIGISAYYRAALVRAAVDDCEGAITSNPNGITSLGGILVSIFQRLAVQIQGEVFEDAQRCDNLHTLHQLQGSAALVCFILGGGEGFTNGGIVGCHVKFGCRVKATDGCYDVCQCKLDSDCLIGHGEGVVIGKGDILRIRLPGFNHFAVFKLQGDFRICLDVGFVIIGDSSSCVVDGGLLQSQAVVNAAVDCAGQGAVHIDRAIVCQIVSCGQGHALRHQQTVAAGQGHAGGEGLIAVDLALAALEDGALPAFYVGLILNGAGKNHGCAGFVGGEASGCAAVAAAADACATIRAGGFDGAAGNGDGAAVAAFAAADACGVTSAGGFDGAAVDVDGAAVAVEAAADACG